MRLTSRIAQCLSAFAQSMGKYMTRTIIIGLLFSVLFIRGCGVARAESPTNLYQDSSISGYNSYNSRVAPHFVAKEFMCHHCGKAKISRSLLYRLELLRLKLGVPIIVTSGYRCTLHNDSVGGTKNSQHKTGKAVDVKVKGYTPEQVANIARLVGFSFIKVYSTHTHIDVR